MSCYIFVIFASLPIVQASGWDDFSSNLATDLAPFLSLFGEQVTKQYLSESTTFLDYFIFAMAPMGIITAVVSAIRVCGSPALRAFVGRAQEGGWQAEVELCSSTSRDVCELYHNGGIARVFGRPKILEVVYDPDFNEPGRPRIWSFRDYVHATGNWYQCPPMPRPRVAVGRTPAAATDMESALLGDLPTLTHAPNLSLNIGIKKRAPVIFWAVALSGFGLQTGALVFACVATYYLKWDANAYACPLAVVGTIMVAAGMYSCAFLIGQRTDE
ncbi:hypothetical protein BJY04DRAFT_213588 [Aspergillus karnatakaensis]|uniref:uncharacterized protein n=1 Tax=Aspergillus karnatakaensis TaxID=1810916 RepID=UPI003CCD7B7E